LHEFETNPVLKLWTKFRKPVIKAKGWATFTQETLGEIVSTIEACESEQLHLINLGDNDLRRAWREGKDLKLAVNELLSMYEPVMAVAKSKPKCHVTVFTLIPSPDTHPNTHEAFRMFERELMRASLPRNPSFHVNNIVKKFTKDNQPILELFKSPTDVHLNFEGTELLVRLIGFK